MSAAAGCVPVGLFALAVLGNLLTWGAVGWFVASRGGWAFVRDRLPGGRAGRTPPPTPPHWQTRADLYAAAPARPEHVVLVGDSLTEFGPWSELLGRTDVLNRGIAGDTVAGVTRRLSPLLQGRPRAVLLLIGINDLLGGSPPGQVVAGLRTLCERIRTEAPDTRLVLQSLLPVDPAVVGHQHPPRIEAVNAALPDLAAEVGATWLDLRPTLGEAACLSADGLHLSALGYRRWANRLAEELG